MALALFDLDNTLLNGDSDHAWGIYLADIGVVDAAHQQQMQDYFYAQYQAGSLDIYEFLKFQLAPLAQYKRQQLIQWRTDFIESIIRPMVMNGKGELLEPHRKRNDDILIITATNDFITRPIAALFGVDQLIATTAEIKHDEYTGRVTGAPCFQNGKVERLKIWMDAHHKNLTGSYFYSDSINDLPLLELADNPIAVTPDSKLRCHAEQSNWQIID